jgi:hypothetical protein
VKKRCEKSQRYVSRAEAEAAIERMVQKWGNVLYKRPYRCGKCRAWHITSTPRLGAGRRI